MALDHLELKRKLYTYFRVDLSKYVHNRPTMVKTILDIINLEARVNVRDLKDKIRKVNISDFSSNVVAILIRIELLYDFILSENKTHNDFLLDILEVLHTI